MSNDNVGPVPEFPRLAGGSTVRIQKDWHARAWAGPGARLVKLQTLIEDALAKAYVDAVRALPPGASTYEPERLAQALRLSVQVTGNRGKLSRSGDLEAILAETDASEIESVEMSNSYGADPVRLELLLQRADIDAVHRSVRLRISGADKAWVGGMAEVLIGELSKNVPRWAWLRHPMVSLLMGVLATCGVIVGLVLVADGSSRAVAQGLVYGAFLGVCIGVFAVPGVMKRLFPGFEVYEHGDKPSGARSLAIIGTVLATLISVAGLVLGILAL